MMYEATKIDHDLFKLNKPAYLTYAASNDPPRSHRIRYFSIGPSYGYFYPTDKNGDVLSFQSWPWDRPCGALTGSATESRGPEATLRAFLAHLNKSK